MFFDAEAERPETALLDCQTILKDLAREVKNAERISLKVFLNISWVLKRIKTLYKNFYRL
jgi:hypothetical protein